MSMSHGGHTGHMPASGDRKALVISGWLTGLYFIVELGIGIWTGSVAVMSDAFHTFSAVGGVLIALVAMRLGERKSSPARTFGYIRAEILGALFNGLFLVAMALLVFWMGAMRLMEPIELATTPMLIAAAGGHRHRACRPLAPVRAPEGQPEHAWRLLARYADLRR
ncbi:cation diffusion facilitator family transporter [Paracoccus yeei]|uniref:cation diffusion facilitator family transporter n=1 Tax=Paracoccus yeei TaxID=147645 RepID=UPI003BF7FE3C